MLKDIKKILKQSAIYGLSRLSIKLVSFILLPIYTLKLSLFEYGIYIRIDSLWQILWALYLFGIETAVIKWYSSQKEEKEKKSFLFTIFTLIAVLNVIFNIAVLSSSGIISEIIFKDLIYSKLVMYASFIATFEAVLFLYFLILRMQEKAVMYAFFSVLNTILFLVIQLYFLYYTDIKLEGIFIAKVLSGLVITVLLFPTVYKNLQFKFQNKFILPVIKFSFPIMVASLLGTALNQVDRYIIGILLDSQKVGIYGLAYNIAGFINFFVVAPFSLAFSVISWKKYEDENAKRFFTKTITYIYFSMIYLAIIISILIPNFIKVFTLNVDYWAAKNIVPYIAVSTPFYGIVTVGFFSFYATKKTYYITYFYLAAVILNIILNIILISQIDIVGAAIANYISFAFLSLIVYKYSMKNFFFKYEWGKIVIMTITSLMLIVPFFIFDIKPIYFQIILKVLAISIFPFILYFLNFYEPIEIIRIKGFFSKYFRILKKW